MRRPATKPTHMPPARRRAPPAARARRSDFGGKHNFPEHELSKACDELNKQRWPWVLCTATANGARMSWSTAKKMKESGVKRGVPDWLIFEGGPDGSRGLAIELKIKHKSKKNEPSPEQEAWFWSLRSCGWRCV